MKKLGLLIVCFALFVGTLTAQNKVPLIGSEAPVFTVNTTLGKLTFPDDYGTSWKIIFSHPQDFTPVCTTELLELAYFQKKFKELDVKVAVISLDNVERHNEWVAYLEEIDYQGRGFQSINFPLIDDSDGMISKKYGMIHPNYSTNRDVRGVFIIDPDNVIRSINFYPMEVGRNMEEIVRIVTALQETAENNVYTPANWKEGGDLIVPYLPYSKEELTENPELENMYYNVGNRVWFKKVN